MTGVLGPGAGIRLSNIFCCQTNNSNDTAKCVAGGHLYWAQVAGRDGEKASDQTTFVWSTMHKLYPGWRFISEERKQFEF